MTSFSIDVRLRPTRFGFLVAPNDMAALRLAFQVNTCLWGGKYNPIIPIFAKRPKWWERHRITDETAEQIVNGYLDYFEPDVLVETQAGQAASLGYNPDRIISIDALIPQANRLDIGYSDSHGLSVFPLYHHLYQREFQFAKREPEKIVRIASETPALTSLAACVFGAFPERGAFHELERGFDEVFSPEILNLNASTVADIISSNWRNPLHFTHDSLEVEYGHHIDPRVFVFDASRASDLIDYWNLRAGVAPVLPVPVQFAAELGPLVRRFVKQNFRPLPNNRNGVMIRPTVMFGRAIASEAIEPLFNEHFRVDVEGANCLQTWYPSFWRPTSEIMVSPTRTRVTAKQTTSNSQVDGDNPALRFDSLKPDFAPEYGGSARWANVVKLDDWSHQDRFATTYLDNFRNPQMPNFGGRIGEFLATTEGYVELAKYARGSNFWRLESTTDAVTKWLDNRGIKTQLSGSGRATRQIIETLGNLRCVSAVANAEVVKLLDGISRKSVVKCMEHSQFRNRVSLANKDNIWSRGAARTLIEKNAVELGNEVRCDKCGSWSWYALSELSSELKCSLCLKAYGFPSIDPAGKDRARWAYRLIGPFAQPNYAHGGYAAALSIRVFAEAIQLGHGPSLTWCAGQELTFPGGEKVEADFILWYRRGETYGHSARTELVFGEAKSFGKECFGVQDIDRMKALAVAFPGAALVFATMKAPDELSQDEIKRLRDLALWGRHYERQRRQTRAPVIILTGHELFVDHSLSLTWKQLGGRHAELIEPAYVRLDNLRVLADLTQQLYLGLEPYGKTLMRKWERQRGKTRSP
jgi:hypothetical protein